MAVGARRFGAKRELKNKRDLQQKKVCYSEAGRHSTIGFAIVQIYKPSKAAYAHTVVAAQPMRCLATKCLEMWHNCIGTPLTACA